MFKNTKLGVTATFVGFAAGTFVGNFLFAGEISIVKALFVGAFVATFMHGVPFIWKHRHG